MHTLQAPEEAALPLRLRPLPPGRPGTSRGPDHSFREPPGTSPAEDSHSQEKAPAHLLHSDGGQELPGALPWSQDPLPSGSSRRGAGNSRDHPRRFLQSPPDWPPQAPLRSRSHSRQEARSRARSGSRPFRLLSGTRGSSFLRLREAYKPYDHSDTRHSPTAPSPHCAYEPSFLRGCLCGHGQ